MHTYKQSEPGVWTVGYYAPRSYDSDGNIQISYDWQPLCDCKSAAEAQALVSYLNGGTKPS
jgi:hypothetical protein